MVAVVSGNGLGLSNTSLRQLGQGLGGQASIGQGGVDQYLNIANGNLTLQNADEGLVFDGLPLSVLRTYNSQGQLTGNDGWLFGFSRQVGGLSGTLNSTGSTVARTGDDGTVVTYAYDSASGRYVSQGQSGTEQTLSWDVATSTWTWSDSASGQQETYDASGQLKTLSNTRSGASYSFTYVGGRLDTITAGDGDALSFTYTGSQLTGLSITAVPPGGGMAVTRQQVSYSYDPQGRLSTVTTTLASDTDPSGGSYATTYTYDGSSDRVASVSQDDGTVVSYTYAIDTNGAYRVASITTGSGAAAQVLTLSYDLGTDTTTVTDALNQRWAYTYDVSGHLTQVVAPTVNGSAPTTMYQYAGDGNLQQVTDADGGLTIYGYDSHGNLQSVEDALGNTTSYTYNAANQCLTSTRTMVASYTSMGQSGTFTFHPASGEETTYYVYDTNGLLSYVIDAQGQVTEHDYTTTDGTVKLSGTVQYAGASYDVTGLSSGMPPSLADLQGWVASAPVQSTRSTAQRTDYHYDVRGQLDKRTQWDQLSGSGAGTLAGDVGATVTTYTHDAQGRLLQTGTQRGADRQTLETSSYAYDGLGRLISSTDALGQVTSYVYTDSAHTLAITQANGLTLTQVRNSAGQLMSSTQAASGASSRTTQYLYNSLGQAIATIDPIGDVSYTFYDADGQVAGTVDATGAVTALRYDADGHVIGTTQYATLLDTSGWVSGGALTASLPASLPVPTANANDRTSQVIVDALGQVVATLDADGFVTTTTYDGVGNALSHTAYATALTPTQRSALGSAPTLAALQSDLSSSPDDRLTVTVYDTDNRVVASIDAAGYVSTMRYDSAGRVVATKTYATALTPTQRSALGSAPTLSALQTDLTASIDDQSAHIYYDGEGRVAAQVDAAGYLSTLVYDETTHTDVTTRYATPLTSVQLAGLTGAESVATLVGYLGAQTANQQSRVSYDADDQVTSRTAADGTVTSYRYNTVGQLLRTTVTPAAGQGTVRVTATEYDAFGEIVGTLDGVGAANLTEGMTPAQQAAIFATKGTTYAYNALGQRVTATDALGNITYTYYDATGRVAYTVQGQPNGSTLNARGNITAYHYNAFGQVTSTRRYASQLTLTGGSSSGTTLNPNTATLAQVASAAAALPVSVSDADGLTTYTYTLDGQVASSTDGRSYQTAYSYDAFGDLKTLQRQLSAPGSALSAANSTLSTFAYDSRGLQTAETEASGTGVASTTGRTYDAYGRVTAATDGNGNVASYVYDRLGRQVSSSQMVGGPTRTTQTTYDAFDRVVTQTDAQGNITAYQYDLAAHKTIVTTPEGVQMTTVTDALGDTVKVIDGANNATTYTYDADGHLQTTTDALGNISHNDYNADGELIQSTDATGHVISYSYDASGRVLSRTVDPGSTGHLNLVTTYVYDGEGRALSFTDPTGMVTTCVYDAEGDVLTQVVDAGIGKLNLKTTYTYDGACKTLTVTVGAGTVDARTTQYVYDSLERLSQQIVDPGTLKLTTSYAYDHNGNLTSVVDPKHYRTLYVYNQANELNFTIDPTGAVVQRLIDMDGRQTGVHRYAKALSAAQLDDFGAAPTADQVGNQCFVIGSAEEDEVSYTVYDANGRVRYTVDSEGYLTESRYDAAGRLSETLAYAHAASASVVNNLAWDMALGDAYPSMASLVSNAGNTDATAEATLHLYDADGQARFTVQQNTVNGQLVGVVSEQRTDAAGRVIATVTYGSTLVLASNQPLSAQLSTSSVTQALASASKQLTQYVYDAAGRQRYTIDTTNHVVENVYHNDGRVWQTLAYVNAITLPGTLTEATVAAAVTAAGTSGARISTTTYDAVGRVLTTGDALNGTLGVSATYSYDATGLLKGQADRDGHWTWMLYDKAGRKTVSQSPAVTVGSYDSNGVLQSSTQYLYTTYGYDDVGNVVAIAQGSGPDSDHITTLSTTGYVYDAVGHQVTTTYPGSVTTHVTYNALGQAVVDKDANGHYQYKVYDTDGEVAYAVDADGYVTGYHYDAHGNVISITRYATALNTAAISGWSAGQSLSLSQLTPPVLVAASDDRTITTTYDLRNQKTQVTQPSVSYYNAASGAVATGTPTTTYTYDAYGNVTSSATLTSGTVGQSGTSAPVWATTYTYYDALNRAVMSVDPMGYVTTTAYNTFGEVTGTTEYAQAIATGGITTATPPATPSINLSDRATSYGYDAIGRKTSITTTGVYSYNNLTSAAGIASLSSVTSIDYDGENHIKTMVVNGETTTTLYDAAGRLLSVTAPARSVLVSNWQSLLLSSGNDLTTASLYTSVSPVTSYVYDTLGNALSTTVSGGDLTEKTLATYDALGRQLTTTDAKGNVQHATYDNNGNVLTQSYTLTGNTGSSTSTVTTTYTYDAANQQLSTVAQRSGQSGYDSYTRVQYNAFGEVIARGDNASYEAQYGYNNAGQLISAPDSTTSAIHTYGYNLAGVLLTDTAPVTAAAGSTYTHYAVDLDGRTTSQRNPSSSSAAGETATVISLSHDRWGNVTATTDANGHTTTALYDSQNQMIQETEPNVLVVSATGVRTWATPTKSWYYNVKGELRGITDENGHASWNTYGTAGVLTVAQDATGAKTYTAYDALGRAVAQQTPPVQTASNTVAHITYTAYNVLNQVVEQGDFLLNTAGTARTQQSRQTYILNSNGDRIKVTDALNHSTYYDYDSQHRVLKSETPAQYAAGKAQTFTYDVNGNLIHQVNASGYSQNSVYDYFGHIQSHVDESGATTNYTYDPDSGLLVKETSDWTSAGHSGGIASTQNFQYMADGQLAQLTETVGGRLSTYTYEYDANENQMLETASTVDGGGLVVATQTEVVYDSHNRLQEVTVENASGTVATMRTVYNYDAVGNRRAVLTQSAYGDNAAPIDMSPSGPSLVTALGAQTVQPGQSLHYVIPPGNFNDPLALGLTYKATLADGSALPSWLSFNTNTLTFSGTPPRAAGSYSVLIVGTDALGRVVSANFNITVPTVAPSFSGSAVDHTFTFGSSLSFTVPAASDANGYTVSYIVHGMPSWMSLNQATMTFSGTPPTGSAGVYHITYDASAGGLSVSQGFNLTVLATSPTVGTALTDKAGVIGGSSLTITLPVGAFANPSGAALTYSVMVLVPAHQQIEPGPTGPPSTATENIDAYWEDLHNVGLNYDPTTGTITGVPTVLTYAIGVGAFAADTHVASYAIQVIATNSAGSASSQFTLNNTYAPPSMVAPLSTQTLVPGSAWSWTIPGGTFSNPYGGALSYSASNLPPGLSISSTGTVSGTPNTGGSWNVIITATDALGHTGTATLPITVSNVAPKFTTAASSQNILAGHALSFSVPGATDANGYSITYSASYYNGSSYVPLSSSLTWLSFNALTRTFSGTPPTSAIGSYQIAVTATAGGFSPMEVFTLTVSASAPIYEGTLTNQAGAIGGSSLNIQLPAGAFANPSTGAISYTVQVLIPAHQLLEPGPTGPPSTATENVDAQWVALTRVGLSYSPTTGTITGVPTALTYQTGGGAYDAYTNISSYVIGITATNSVGSASGQFTLSNSYAPPAQVNSLSSQTLTPAVAWNWSVPAGTFSNPYGGTLTYSATGLPSGLSMSSAGVISGTPHAAGTWNVTIKTTDGLGHSGTATLSVTVPNVAPVFTAAPGTQNVTSGVAFSFTVPPATDANGYAINYTVAYVQGSDWVALPSWLQFNASTRTFSGTAPTTGSFTIVVGANVATNGLYALEAFTINAAAPAAPTYTGPTSESMIDATPTAGLTRVLSSVFHGTGMTYQVSYASTLHNFTATVNASTGSVTLVAPVVSWPPMAGKVTIVGTDALGRTATAVIQVEVYPSTGVNPPGGGGVGGMSIVLTEDLDSSDEVSTESTQTVEATQSMATTPNVQAEWFTYDADNRVLVNDGALVNSQIVVTSARGSAENHYDAAGNVTIYNTVSASGQNLSQQNSYDERDELLMVQATSTIDGQIGISEMRSYDKDGRLVSDAVFRPSGHTESAVWRDSGVIFSDAGWVQSDTIYTYDADGRLTDQSQYVEDTPQDLVDANGPNLGNSAYALADQTAPETLPSVGSNTDGVLLLNTEQKYAPSGGQGGYDADGNLLGYQVFTPANFGRPGAKTDSYLTNYVRKDGVLNIGGSATSTDSSFVPGTTTNTYDDLGNLIKVTSSSAGNNNLVRTMAYGMGGEVLRQVTTSGTSSQTSIYAYANGQALGSVDLSGHIDVQATSSGYSNSTLGAGRYVVQVGDKLDVIAQQVYGNSSYSYLIAEANGLQLDDGSDLIAGSELVIPQVTTSSNTATTFKPYNPNDLIGSTTPSLTVAPPPPPSSSCSGLAQIVVIAIVVVASIYTAGAAAGYFAAAGTTAAGTGTAALGATVLSGGTVAGLTTAEGLAAASIGGFAGNVAGQFAGDALGTHQGFSFGEALVGGLTAAATAGAGGAISGTGGDYSILANANGSLRPAGAALLGASGYASDVAASKVTGQSTHFSWADVVASAASAGVTSAYGLSTNNQLQSGVSAGSFARDFEGSLVNGALQSETARLLGGTAANSGQIVQDAFGNALGNAAIRGLTPLPPVNASTQLIDMAPPDTSLVVEDVPQVMSAMQVEPIVGNSADAGSDMEWRAPGYFASAVSPAEPVTLGTIHVGPNGSWVGHTYSAYDNWLFARGMQMESEDQQNRIDEARVNAQRAAEYQSGQEINLRAAQIERAQFGMLGQGLVGAAKALPNLMPETINGAMWLGQKGLALYALGTGNAGLAQAINQAPLPQVPLIFGYDNAYQAGGAQGMDTVMALASVPEMVDGAVMLSMKAAPYASKFLGELGDLRVMGSTGGYGDLTGQLGAVGDLKGFRPNIGDTLSVPDTAGIADSTASLSGSSPSQLARSWQGSGSYPGVDSWVDTNLSQGTYVVGAAPGQSEFYTTLEGFNGTDGTAESYYQNLQIGPNTTNPDFPAYRDGVTVYQVNPEGVPAASSNALANPQFGPGGAPQLFIPGYQNSLTPFYSIPFK